MWVLHCGWVPTQQSGGKFVLWAEDSDGWVSRNRRGRPPSLSINRPQLHPFQLDPSKLNLIVKEVAREAGLTISSSQLTPQELVAFLPTDRYLPRPSFAFFDGGEERVRQELKLSPWLISVVALEAKDALTLLVSGQLSGKKWHGSDAWNYWQHAAWWAQSLMKRERFFPALFREYGDKGPKYRAGWMAALDQFEEKEQLRRLAACMPDSCRSLFWNNGKGDRYEPLSAEVLTGGFVQEALDATVRSRLKQNYRSSKSMVNLQVWPSRLSSLVKRWMETLQRGDGPIQAPQDLLEAMHLGWEQWVSWAPEAEGRFRLCFRLEAPPEGSDLDSTDGYWTLCFLLQAVYDPSLVLQASDLWNADAEKNTGSPHSLARQGQTALLRELPRAASLMPELEASLSNSRPEYCQLNTVQAYKFLSDRVPVLIKMGFGIFVPAWWEEARQDMALKLKIRAPKSAGTSSGMFGMDAVLEYDWQLSLGGETVNPEEFERLARLKVPLVRIGSRWIEIDQGKLERVIKFLNKSSNQQLGPGEVLALGLGKGETGDLRIENVEADGWFAEMLDNLQGNTQFELLPQPESFHGTLRPYQVRGFSWMAFLRKFRLGGCLADDMGLGKTIQFLALLLQEQQAGWMMGPTLLVCPTSVLGNWQREAGRFAPGVKVLLHHGPQRFQGKEFLEQVQDCQLVITSYGLVYRDFKTLEEVRWNGVVLDEAQNIKNHLAKQSRAINRLQSEYRLALTGTPVENHLGELWSLIQFLNPGYLGSYQDFRQRFAVPIERHHDETKGRKLRQMVQPFVLRRTKKDPDIISDLPEKQEIKQYCILTREQASLYQAVVDNLLLAAEELEGIQRKGLILASLTKLKQICNHPAQFLHSADISPKRSGKLQRLTELLEETLELGEKALIFTQFAQMGQLLKNYLERKLKREVLFLHGGVIARKRDEMVQRFQGIDRGSSPEIFILSLKAGGVGLNLTAANHVFHFDRWWNPAVENQASDRAFRLGQERNVLVHKFICQGTLEERIDRLLEEKQSLADNIIGSGENWLTELSTEELRSLLKLEAEAVGE